MAYQDIVAAKERLVILRHLQLDPGYDHQEGMLFDLANDGCGVQVSRDMLRMHLAWLTEQGLISLRTVEAIGTEVRVAKLTGRGDDVAAGRAVVPGVKRPGPDGL